MLCGFPTTCTHALRLWKHFIEGYCSNHLLGGFVIVLSGQEERKSHLLMASPPPPPPPPLPLIQQVTSFAHRLSIPWQYGTACGGYASYGDDHASRRPRPLATLQSALLISSTFVPRAYKEFELVANVVSYNNIMNLITRQTH